jgi:hypothetical protein
MTIVSDCIQPIGLPPINAGTFVGVTAIVCGWGRTTQSKCVDPFNSYSTDYERLLYKQCHMDVIEVTHQYIISNATVTHYECNLSMRLLHSSQLKSCVRAGSILWCKEHRKDCGESWL